MEPKNWEEFGRKIWDTAMNAHVFGAQKVEVPFQLPDGAMATVTVNVPTYIQKYIVLDEKGSPEIKWRHGVKLSDGHIKWED